MITGYNKDKINKTEASECVVFSIYSYQDYLKVWKIPPPEKKRCIIYNISHAALLCSGIAIRSSAATAQEMR
jgi:hypothetical protein